MSGCSCEINQGLSLNVIINIAPSTFPCWLRALFLKYSLSSPMKGREEEVSIESYHSLSLCCCRYMTVA